MTLDPQAVKRNAFVEVFLGQLVVLLYSGQRIIGQREHKMGILPCLSSRVKEREREREGWEERRQNERSEREREGGRGRTERQTERQIDR